MASHRFYKFDTIDHAEKIVHNGEIWLCQGEKHTLFQTKIAQKPYVLGPHIPIYAWST